ncbi:heterogeneous nuclear ribonucleoprotein K-like [Chironomus tepperi]|uniref:heterogeneous nuclear ribonucleoprotein K-like n=1 Tax=Chironomus tepperi TaxID=113505 RepID=UPI00391FAF5B
MKRANEDDEVEVKEDEIKQELEPPALNQEVENSCQNSNIENKNEEVQDVRPINPPKRRRKNEDDTEIRILISSKMAGAIIGKSGQNIQKLRSDHDARVNIVDCKGPERVLTIVSTLDVCYKVIPDILKHFEPSQLNEYDLRFLVHQSLAGCIIGKSGSKIKELKSKFGCLVKVFPNVAPQSFERVVQIVAVQDKLINCFTEIMNLIKSNSIRGPIRFYDPHNFDDHYADEYGGYGTVISRNGNVPFQRQFNDNRNNNFNNNRGKFNNDRRGDTRRSIKNESNFVDPWAPNSFGNNQIPQMNNFGTSNISNDFISFNSFLNKPEETSTQVTIPIHLAGALIGKGGTRIRSIRNESKASIKIDQPLPGSQDRIITITGTPKQIESAQYLLQRSVQNGLN